MSKESKASERQDIEGDLLSCATYLPFGVLWDVQTQFLKADNNKRKARKLGIRSIQYMKSSEQEVLKFAPKPILLIYVQRKS